MADPPTVPVIVEHLVYDNVNNLAICCGKPWPGVPSTEYPKVPRMLCPLCQQAAAVGRPHGSV